MFLAAQAHQRGLAIGLKNDLEQIPQLVSFFDFSVNEECHQFNECTALSPFITQGKPVFNAEYQEALMTSAKRRQEVCEESQALGLQTLFLPLDLDDSFRYSCTL